MLARPLDGDDSIGYLAAGVGSVEEVVELAREAGLNEKALEADLQESTSSTLSALGESCR
jgi:hypothetical protein